MYNLWSNMCDGTKCWAVFPFEACSNGTISFNFVFNFWTNVAKFLSRNSTFLSNSLIISLCVWTFITHSVSMFSFILSAISANMYRSYFTEADRIPLTLLDKLFSHKQCTHSSPTTFAASFLVSLNNCVIFYLLNGVHFIIFGSVLLWNRRDA